MEFTLYTKTPNSINNGRLYLAEIDVPFDKEKRTIRVFVPESYNHDDKNTKYKVLFFADGQNIVDKYTTMYGDWDFGSVLNKMYQKGYEKLIVVGIDSPNEELKRSIELAPPYVTRYFKKEEMVGCANTFIDFILDDLLFKIEKHFNISTKVEDIGIGGSSMGGIMSFYAYCYRRKDFGFALSFSPAFLLYQRYRIKQYLKNWKPDKDEYGKLFFFVGGKGFESKFYKDTILMFNFLRENNFDDSKVRLIFDSNMIHHESSWNKYLEDALSFFLNK